MGQTIEQAMRFSGRNAITNMGNQQGEKAAIEAAQGLLRAAVDELVTMRGHQFAYEFTLRAAEDMVASQAKEFWAAKKT